SATAALLPVSQVVLFSSGVGHFVREGAVEGDARVDLSFPARDVNDLIKSLALRDLDGGRIDAVSYDSNAPVERTLQSFAINLTGSPSFAQLLHQARGEKVEVVLQQGAAQPGTLTGAIVGVEHKKQAVGNSAVEVECLTLWCSDGMRSLKLSEVQRVRFLNAVMDSEFKKALETLALGHDAQKKSVSIHFAGEGRASGGSGSATWWRTPSGRPPTASPSTRPTATGGKSRPARTRARGGVRTCRAGRWWRT